MSRCKHTYTDEAFPTNTGSLNRPARFNLRLTCSARARTHKVFGKFRKHLGLPERTNYAAVFETSVLPVLEHVLRKIETGDTATQEFFKSLAKPLPKEDYQLAIYRRLKAKFEPGK